MEGFGNGLRRLVIQPLKKAQNGADGVAIFGDDEGFGVALDSDNNIYTAGDFTGTADFDPSPTGTGVLWYVRGGLKVSTTATVDLSPATTGPYGNLLVWAPASWLAWGVTKASQEQVQWRDVRGTVWSGSAQLVLSGGKGTLDAQALPGRLQWTLHDPPP